MATEKCPYCYRSLGTHTHDPILLPNGSKYKWSDDTHLIEESDLTKRIYKGTYQINEDDVIELQDELKTLEEGSLPEIDRTTFSPLNSSGKFQIIGKHIKEMRDSVEKLLDIMGLTKTDYFNYDEDGNHIINPIGDKIEWTDPITNATDLQKFQVKYIHIEDLRRVIMGNFIYISTTISPSVYRIGSKDNLQIFTSYTPPLSSIAVDNQYLYIAENMENNFVKKLNKSNGSLVTSCYISGDVNLKSLCVDENYVWVLDSTPGGITRIIQIDKSTMIIVNANFITGLNPRQYIQNDSTFLYIKDIIDPTFDKINKLTKTLITYDIGNIFYSGQNFKMNSIGFDENYFYFIFRINSNTYPYSILRKGLLLVDKSITFVAEIDIGLENLNDITVYSDILVDKKYIYVLCIYSWAGGSNKAKLYVINKEDYSLVYSIINIDGQILRFTDILDGYFGGRMSSEYFYRSCLTL